MANKTIELLKKQIVFIMYTISAGISFVLDLTLFTIFNKLLSPAMGESSILLSTLIARIISSFINYLMNRNKVFSNNSSNLYDAKTLIKYYILVAIQLCVSALSVYLIHQVVNTDATLIKIPVDIIIFIINYFIQKYLIFKESEESYEVQK